MDEPIVCRDPKGDRRDGKRASESAIAIRRKSSFWRASARLQRCDHENFFVAKPCDSESARTTFRRRRCVDATPIARRSSSSQIQKCATVQAISAILSSDDAHRFGIFCIDARACCDVADVVASRARTFPCQHFLKWEAVFLDALVYSGCSASRFPSARSRLKPSHLH